MPRSLTVVAQVVGSLVILALLACTPAAAAVQKSMAPCDGEKLCAAYTVPLTPPDGWAIDEAASVERGVKILVPKGQTFDSARALIYVQVFYTPDKTLSLADFALDSNNRWQARAPGSKIASRPQAARKSGRPAFLVFAYDNPGKQGQAYELGAFGPEKDSDGNAYVVNVVLSGLDKAAVDTAEPVYLALLKGL